MEIKVTELVASMEPELFSNSIANSGRTDIGRVTWNNAMERAEEADLVSTDEEVMECKRWFKEFGAWTEEEIAEWDTQTVNALLLQIIAAELREKEWTSLFCSGNDVYLYIGI